MPGMCNSWCEEAHGQLAAESLLDAARRAAYRRRTMTNTRIKRIDWAAVEAIAVRLGVHTRRLVASRDVDAIEAWARRLHQEHSGPASITYLELATLVGTESRDGDE
jgi:hypothetical protein